MTNASLTSSDLETAAQLLVAAAIGSDRRGLRRALHRLADVVVRVTYASLRRIGARLPAHLDRDDVVHEVQLRLMHRPPTQIGSGSALQAVKAWVSRTTIRIAIDASRRKGNFHNSYCDDADGLTHEPRPQLDARASLAAVRSALAADYPRGVALFDIMAERGWLSSRELAELTGHSVANIDKIRSRIRGIARAAA